MGRQRIHLRGQRGREVFYGLERGLGRLVDREVGHNGVVTAQIWYPKIWAKFSLFVLHCIKAYIFKLLS